MNRLLADLQAGKAHKGQRQQACGNKTDRCAGKGGRHACQRQAFAHPGKDHQHQAEAERGTEAVQRAFHETGFFLRIDQRHAEYGDDGQGDIAPEDLQNPTDTAERPEFTDEDNLASPQDLRASLPVDEIAESGIEG